MSTTTTRQTIHDKIATQITSAHVRLELLKAKALEAKANAELKTITELQTQKQALEQDLTDLKATSESAYQKAKTDVESRIARLEKQVQAIETKFKAA
jgi:phage host-nuclease inhibitor protein Gam